MLTIVLYLSVLFDLQRENSQMNLWLEKKKIFRRNQLMERKGI